MFTISPWTSQWLHHHCMHRFNMAPRPFELVVRWKFDDLLSIDASRILFTNGMNDEWSVGGVTQNLSEDILAMNFENGAHHSDLLGVGPTEDDTWDIKEGSLKIEEILGTWLDEIRSTKGSDDDDDDDTSEVVHGKVGKELRKKK